MCTIGDCISAVEDSYDDINIFVNDGHYDRDEEGGDGGVMEGYNDNNNHTVMFYLSSLKIKI